jgi:hypothetical protein
MMLGLLKHDGPLTRRVEPNTVRGERPRANARGTPLTRDVFR